MAFNFHTNFLFGSYQQDVRQFLVLAENPTGNLSAHYEGTSIAIGYGYDLLQHTNAQVRTALAQVGITLTQQQEQLLDQARAGSAEIKSQVASQLNLNLSSQNNAIALLDYSLREYEDRLNNLMAGISIPNSRERVALLSMVYAGRLQDYGGDFPVLTPLKNALINGNRAEAWFTIRYLGSHAKNQINANGYAKRAYAESQIFGLYESVPSLDEAINAYTTLGNHRAEILQYEDKFGVQVAAATTSYGITVETLEQSFDPAKHALLADERARHPELANILQDNAFSSVNIYLANVQDANDPGYVNARPYEIGIYSDTGANDLLLGMNGNDVLYGGRAGDVLIGEGGDDSLYGEEGNDTLAGGDGFDTYVYQTGGGSDTIKDTDGVGQILFDGVKLTGGSRQDETNPYVSDDGKHNYSWDGNDLLVDNGLIRIAGFQDGDLGISLEDDSDNGDDGSDSSDSSDSSGGSGTDGNGASGGGDNPFTGPLGSGKWSDPLNSGDLINNLQNELMLAEQTVSPLILDLDGDGIETISKSAGIHFDHDGNHFAETTGWVGKDDGLLVLDRNGNGTIDDGSELFGNNTYLSNGSKAANGFAALSELDSNQDGKIDAADAAFNQLRVWKDSDSNGVVSKGELLTLDAAGVQSLTLAYTSQNLTDAQGNSLKQIGQYTRIDGSVRKLADVWFSADLVRTVEKNVVKIDASIMALPELKGFSNVHGLREAMMLDTSGKLQSLVNSFALETDPAKRDAIMTDLMYRWVGVDGIDPKSRQSPVGNYMDARQLEVVEAFLGTTFSGNWGSSPGVNQSGLLIDMFNKLKNYFEAQLVAQTDFKSLYDSINITWNTATSSPDFNVSAIVNAFRGQYWSDPDKCVGTMVAFGENLNQLGSFGKEIIKDIQKYTDGSGEGFSFYLSKIGTNAFKGGTGNDSLVGGAAADVITDSGGNNTIDSGTGNDCITLNGSGTNTIHAGDGNDVVTVSYLNNGTIDGGAGDDVLTLTRYTYVGNGLDSGYYNTVNTFIGGTGNDTITSSSGADIYVFNRGDGQDVITDYGDNGYSPTYTATYSDPDKIVFGAGISVSDIGAKRVGNDMVLMIQDPANVATDQITVKNWFAGAGYRIESLQFADGSSLSMAQLHAMGLTITGTNDADVISGWQESNTIYGLDGNDTITDNSGNDTINGGDGDDTITDSGGNNVIDGGTGSDTIKIAGSGNNTIDGGTGNDSITLSTSGMNTIHAGDGNDVVTVSYLNNGTIDGGAGDDVLTMNRYLGQQDSGFYNTVNTFIGGTGNDTITSSSGADIYVFNRGDGQDVITDYGDNGYSPTYTAPYSDPDKIVFGVGISVSDIGAKRVGNDMVLMIQDPANVATDQITVKNWFAGAGYRIESLQFADGSSLNITQLHAMVTTGTAGDDVMTGWLNEAALFNGFGGNDTIQAMAGNDTINGGDGDDTITDSGGNNVIDGGTGIDTIKITGSGNNIIDGGAGNDSITLNSSGTNTIHAGDGNDVVTVSYLNNGTIDGGAGDDVLTLTRWTTNGQDSGYNNTVNIFIGGTGNDTITSSSGADTYVFNRGDGQDTILDYGDNAYYGDSYTKAFSDPDKIVFGAGISVSDIGAKRVGNDMVLMIQDPANVATDQITVKNWFAGAGYRIESLQFADGSSLNITQLHAMVTTGTAGDDVMTGWLNEAALFNGFGGNDTIQAMAGNDTINGGDGDDTITDSGGNNVIDGGAGTDTIKITGSGNNIIDGGAGNDSITLNGSGTNTIHAGDGNDVVTVSYLNNGTIDGGAGDDVLTLTRWTTNGQDSGYNNTVNIFIGGTGNDTITSSSGADTYVFNRGDGQDTILDYGGNAYYGDSYTKAFSDSDKIVFGAGITVADLSAKRVGNDMVVTIKDPANVATDQITIKNWFVSVDYRIESLEFADGSSLSMAQLNAIATIGTEGDDLMTGWLNESASFYGLGGNDTIQGSGGNDTINGGDGNDTITDIGGNNTIEGGAGNDSISLSAAGTNTILAGDGNDMVSVSYMNNGTIDGGAGDDVLTLNRRTGTTTAADSGYYNTVNTFIGGTGNDTISSSSGADTYVFNRGDGQDTITDYAANTAGASYTAQYSDPDKIVFGAGITVADLSAKRTGNDMVVTIKDPANVATDQITIKNWFVSVDYRIESLEFADGSSLSMAQVHAMGLTVTGTDNADVISGQADNDMILGKGGVDSLSGSSGNDLLNGGADNDTVDGGVGNDFLIGGTGNDTIITGAGYDVIAFNKGDGQDTVMASTGKDNTLSLGNGIQYADLLFSKNGNDLVLGTGTSDQITFKDWYASTGNHSVATLQMVIEGSSDYDSTSTNSLNNQKIQQFNFDGLVGQFDQARTADPSLNNWALSSAVLNFRLGGSDTAAIGGDLAYQYALNGNLAGLSVTAAQTALSNSQFGTGSQSVTTTSLQDLSPKLS